MSLLTKECEVCGTKISKLKNWYRLVFIDLSKCPNCKREYTLSKWFKWIIDVYSLGFILIILIVVILDKLFNNLGIEVWLISLIIYLLIKFLIALVTPIDFGDFLARVSGVRNYQLYDSVIDLGKTKIVTQFVMGERYNFLLN